MANPTKRFYNLLYDSTGIEGKHFLELAYDYLYYPLIKELDSPPPADDLVCDKLLKWWLETLQNAGFALQHFPTLRLGRGSFAPGGTIAAKGTSPQGLDCGELPLKRDKEAPELCEKRDRGVCVLTGRKSSDGWAVEVAHIMPFAFISEGRRRNLLFWQLVELFFGVEQTNQIFSSVARSIDSLWNLVSLDKSLHALYDSGHLVLVPVTTGGDPIPMSSSYSGTYLLQVRFPYSLSDPDLVTSSRIVGSEATQTLHDGSYVGIVFDPDAPSDIQRLPSPSHFAFRAWFQWLKAELSGQAKWDVNLGEELWR